MNAMFRMKYFMITFAVYTILMFYFAFIMSMSMPNGEPGGITNE